MTAKAELLFAELFHSLLSLDDELNIAQSVIVYFKFMSKDSSRPWVLCSILTLLIFKVILFGPNDNDFSIIVIGGMIATPS